MHFQLVSGDDLALILECSTVTRRISERLDAFEAAHPLIGRLLVTACGITGNATVASDRPLADHLVLYRKLPLAARVVSVTFNSNDSKEAGSGTKRKRAP